MTRDDLKNNVLNRNNFFRDLDWSLQDSLNDLVNEQIDEIYDYFEDKINSEIMNIEKQIIKGFCSDKTQDENESKYEKIKLLKSLLEE